MNCVWGPHPIWGKLPNKLNDNILKQRAPENFFFFSLFLADLIEPISNFIIHRRIRFMFFYCSVLKRSPCIFYSNPVNVFCWVSPLCIVSIIQLSFLLCIFYYNSGKGIFHTQIYNTFFVCSRKKLPFSYSYLGRKIKKNFPFFNSMNLFLQSFLCWWYIRAYICLIYT